MRTKKNKIYLSSEEREELVKITKSGKHSSEEIKRVNILLQLDENRPPVRTQAEIASICHSSTFMVSQVAARFAQSGIASIKRKKRLEPPIKPIVTGDIEARIIAIQCSEPPKGHSRWTLTLTAERLIELKVVSAISRDTVGRVLKKRNQATSQ